MLLRTSSHHPYKKLRELLPAYGVDVRVDVLADLFPDDGDQEFGVLVTAQRRVFTFVLHYGRSGDIRAQVEVAVLSRWNEITDCWELSPYKSEVRAALQMLEES